MGRRRARQSFFITFLRVCLQSLESLDERTMQTTLETDVSIETLLIRESHSWRPRDGWRTVLNDHPSLLSSLLSFFLSFFIFLIFSDIEKMMPWLILQFYVSSSSHLLLKWQPIPTEFVVRCLLNIERHLFESFPIRYHSTSQACICKSSFLCSLLILSSFFPWSPFLSRNQETHQCSLDNSENCWLK